MREQAAGYRSTAELHHGCKREGKEVPRIWILAEETTGDKREGSLPVPAMQKKHCGDCENIRTRNRSASHYTAGRGMGEKVGQ